MDDPSTLIGVKSPPFSLRSLGHTVHPLVCLPKRGDYRHSGDVYDVGYHRNVDGSSVDRLYPQDYVVRTFSDPSREGGSFCPLPKVFRRRRRDRSRKCYLKAGTLLPSLPTLPEGK